MILSSTLQILLNQMRLIFLILTIIMVNSVDMELRRSSKATFVIQLRNQTRQISQQYQNRRVQISNLKQMIQANLSIALFSEISASQLFPLLSLEVVNYKNLKIMDSDLKPSAQSYNKIQMLQRASENNPFNNEIFWVNLSSRQLMKQILQISGFLSQQHTFYIKKIKNGVEQSINLPFENKISNCGQIIFFGGKVEAILTIKNLYLNTLNYGKNIWSEQISLCFLANFVPHIIFQILDNTTQRRTQKFNRYRITFDKQLKFKKMLIEKNQQIHHEKLKNFLDEYQKLSKDPLFFYFKYFAFLAFIYGVLKLVTILMKKYNCGLKLCFEDVSPKLEEQVCLHQRQ